MHRCSVQHADPHFTFTTGTTHLILYSGEGHFPVRGFEPARDCAWSLFSPSCADSDPDPVRFVPSNGTPAVSWPAEREPLFDVALIDLVRTVPQADQELEPRQQQTKLCQQTGYLRIRLRYV